MQVINNIGTNLSAGCCSADEAASYLLIIVVDQQKCKYNQNNFIYFTNKLLLSVNSCRENI